MKIERVEFANFRLPLTRRFRVGTLAIEERAGRFVRLTTTEGLQGHGEIAPLPGLHTESLADVDKVLRAVGPGLQGGDFATFDALAQNIANRVAACAPDGCPSAVFGLQSAAAAVFADQADTTPAAILAKAPRDRVAVNALFVGSPVAAAEAVASGELDAYSCVKVKAGRQSLGEDRDVFKILLAGLPDQTTLRIDANRALSLEDAIQRFEGLPPERIEFLEEPLANPGELVELHTRTGLSIGLDETLHIPSLRDIGRAPYVSAWCLKPSRIGHWGRLCFLAQEAERAGSAVVVSSALESGLGLWAQVQIAAALPGRTAAAGLGTEGWLRLDTVSPPYDASFGVVRTCDWQGSLSERVRAKLRFVRAG
ncbi:MAG: o-succinylbenzoate synthase [Planctomycetota bacterium]|nr:o-succinylbenzoate synthase [Planctomycetota bacterium]